MREIDTRVTTYDPEIVGYFEPSGTQKEAVMIPVEDGTGDWVFIVEHEAVVSALQQRIVYLENVCYEQTRMLTGD